MLHKADDLVLNFSGGEKRRLSVALSSALQGVGRAPTSCAMARLARTNRCAHTVLPAGTARWVLTSLAAGLVRWASTSAAAVPALALRVLSAVRQIHTQPMRGNAQCSASRATSARVALRAGHARTLRSHPLLRPVRARRVQSALSQTPLTRSASLAGSKVLPTPSQTSVVYAHAVELFVTR